MGFFFRSILIMADFRQNMASLKQVVYDHGNQSTKSRAVCFHQGSRKGIEGTSRVGQWSR